MFSRATRNKSYPAAVSSFFFLVLSLAAPHPVGAGTRDKEEEFVQARHRMVERDLRGRGIRDPRVLQAAGQVPRHLFVPESLRASAYEDRPLPIGEGQTISQPYMVALMTELLALGGEEKVLEVGTGSGYQAAVLSHLAKETYTIEILPVLAARARETLRRLGYDSVQVRLGDGFFGWEERAPFDAILVTAAAERIPEPLWRQLREGGRLVMPLGAKHRPQKLVRAWKVKGGRRIEEITDVVFVPMTGASQKPGR